MAEPQITDAEVESVKEGLDDILAESRKEQNDKIQEEAAKKSAESLKNMNIFATKAEVVEVVKALRKENSDLKTLLLRAKERGDINLAQKEEDSTANLKKIYEGTGLFD